MNPQEVILRYFLLWSLSLIPSMATTHIVEWGRGSGLQTWSDKEKFYEGDTLEFRYLPNYDIKEVNQLDYTYCDSSAPSYAGGLTSIPLSITGTLYFIDGQKENCIMGVKLKVKVLRKPVGREVGSQNNSSASRQTINGNDQHVQGHQLPISISNST